MRLLPQMNTRYSQPGDAQLKTTSFKGESLPYLVVADIVIAFVYALSIRSVAQSLGDILYVWYSIHNSIGWPVGISARNRFQVYCMGIAQLCMKRRQRMLTFLCTIGAVLFHWTF